MSVAWGLFILRLAVGVVMLAHGTQKLGYWGGAGFAPMSANFEKRGLRPGNLWAGLAVLGEVGGGLSLLFGFLTPLGAAGALGAMVMAAESHWKKGFFGQKGGFEYPALLGAASVALGIAGPGAISLDGLFGFTAWPQALIFIILGVLAVVVDVVGIQLTRIAAGGGESQPHAA